MCLGTVRWIEHDQKAKISGSREGEYLVIGGDIVFVVEQSHDGRWRKSW